jgi:hypothetical protein
MTDASWIEAVKLPTRVVIGLFFASLILLAFDAAGILFLAAIWAIAKPVVIITSVIFGSLSVTGVVGFFMDERKKGQKQALLAGRRQLRTEEERERRVQAEAAALERIDHLATQELRYLADALRKGSQSFYTYVHSPAVSTLAAKGLVNTPGGTHHQDHYPFTISDFAWKALLARKAEILARDDQNRQAENQAASKRLVR